MKRHLNKIRNKIIKGKGDTDFKDIIIGGFYSLGAKIWFVIASLLTQFIISRYYGAALVGKIAIINNMIHVLTIFTVFGFNISILKHIPDHKVRFSFSSALKVYSKISKIIFAFSMISVIVVFFLAEYIAIHIFNKSDLTIFIRIGSVFILPYSLKVFYDSGFKAFKKVKKLAQIVTISNTLKILLVGLCAYFALNEIYPFVFVFLALLITATGGYFYFKKNIFSKFDSNENIKNESYKALFLFSLPMVFIATSNLLNHNINILILGRYMTDENVGYLNIASKFTGLISFGLLAVN
ncbi:MAG: oligosaccharide flippase family protein, partial [Bacteroidales bacterium]|nr:oligosaccharide flippase family protein [Bacteroidales bacterium]